ncbi:Predicted nucleic acid-binding protein, contains PIN domain [Ferrithrix thermotolerans DSM 19514]|jgi:predicted nucleic acid-binding protein|uniref:Ribonuclease VapC n=1 Tax=Ferrithrix thermotolerans DSM 19514 TaxID=1121881 RepID=A0A1M4YS60_9ACTN|nr:type II toxin-antitoxin system VapC family toxin [Ferrithrix thermotolerans]SHF08528.1 Predicted nucleic acid-binding protein, contains PIN domain [Ferrithrix thermotolerans DSM 19514]
MGLTVIDAGVLIGFFDASDAHHLEAKSELANARQRGDQIAIPASALAEALVSPARYGESSVARVLEFLERLPLKVAELDIETAVAAARLRARHGQKVKLPDALVIATAIQNSAGVLITTDRGWPLKSELGFEGNLISL